MLPAPRSTARTAGRFAEARPSIVEAVVDHPPGAGPGNGRDASRAGMRGRCRTHGAAGGQIRGDCRELDLQILDPLGAQDGPEVDPRSRAETRPGDRTEPSPRVSHFSPPDDSSRSDPIRTRSD